MKNLRLWIGLVIICASSSFLLPSLRAASSTIVISEFRTRGPSGGNDEFVELHNISAAPVNIGGWTIRGSNNAGTTSIRHTVATGTVILPGCFYLAVNTAASGYSGSVPGNGTYATGITDDGGLALLSDPLTIVDQVGMSAGSAYKEGTTLAATTTNANRGIERKPGGPSGHNQDTDNNTADFVAISPGNPQNASSVCISYGALAVSANATPNPVTQFDSTLITAVVTPVSTPPSTGITVTANLSALGGIAAQPLFDDGNNGDAVAGDLTYSYLATVSGSLGPQAVAVSAQDAQGRTAASAISVAVLAPPVIYLPHEIQGAGTTSPFNAATVTVEGVITGRRSNGVFLQTAPGSEDADPLTSEGLFVFTGSAPLASLTVGTLVRATGQVDEFSGDGYGLTLTELENSPTFVVLGASALPAPTPLTAAMLQPGGGLDQLEPFEAMLVSIDALTTSSGTDGAFFSSTGGEAAGVATSTGVFYAVLSGAARPTREPGLDRQIASTFAAQCAAGPPCAIPVFDGNPERLRVDSDAIGAPVFDVTSNVVITNMVAIVDSGFFTWGLLPTPGAPGSAGPNAGGVAVSAPTATQFTVASFNMQRFFDTTNDPGVSEVALTAANYERRLAKASLAIRLALHMPDILGVQEVEKLPVLQDLANRVNADAGLPGEYQAYLVEGQDPGGIDVGFLVRSRVTVESLLQVGLDDALINPATGTPYLNGDGSPQRLNDRPPLVLRATVDGGLTRLDAPIIVVVNHLRSLNGVSDADARVRHKREQQARFLGALLDTLQDERAVVSIGDYNAFEFNDGLVDVMGIVTGAPASGAEVVIDSSDVVEPDFWFASAGTYSYVFDGNAQSLDHVIVSSPAAAMFVRLEHARINADFPEVYRNDATRAERISDHDPAVAYFALPPDTTAPVIDNVPDALTVVAASSEGAVVNYPLPTATDNLDASVVVTCAPASGATFVIGATTVTCQAADLAGNVTTAMFVVTVTDPRTAGAMVGAGRVTQGTVDLSFTFFVSETGAGEHGILLAHAREARQSQWLVALGVDRAFFSNVDGSIPGPRPVSGVDAVTFAGPASWQGQGGYRYRVQATDRGEPGRRDTMILTVWDAAGAVVLQVGGTLSGGNIQSLPTPR